ncbi:MAG: MogA/MoaB family molybdenum cofactor biosynthesis protein [Treponema sp.]
MSVKSRYTAAIICASDRCSQGLHEDTSSSIIETILHNAGYTVVKKIVLPDDAALLSAAMIEIADTEETNLIITTGGTGLAPRDVTPEATAAVIDRFVPGIAEAMRAESMKITPLGMLSRGIAGIRKHTLIVNVPGSPKAVQETLPCILTALAHGIRMLTGGEQDCASNVHTAEVRFDRTVPEHIENSNEDDFVNKGVFL